MNVLKSNLTGTEYNTADAVRIVNPRQAILYIKNNVFPIDVYTSIDPKTDKDIIVWIFTKKDSEVLYKKWLEYDLR